jgi:NADPH2:quinone reductase
VLTTVSDARKAQLAAAAGADHVITYNQQDVVAEVHKVIPHGVDVIVEVAAAANAGIDAAVIGRYGAVSVYADDGKRDLCVPIRPLMVPNARWQFVMVYGVPAEAKRQAVEDVDVAILDGALRVGVEAGVPLHHFPLEQAAEAQTAVEDRVVGKVLIDVAD